MSFERVGDAPRWIANHVLASFAVFVVIVGGGWVVLSPEYRVARYWVQPFFGSMVLISMGRRFIQERRIQADRLHAARLWSSAFQIFGIDPDVDRRRVDERTRFYFRWALFFMTGNAAMGFQWPAILPAVIGLALFALTFKDLPTQ